MSLVETIIKGMKETPKAEDKIVNILGVEVFTNEEIYQRYLDWVAEINNLPVEPCAVKGNFTISVTPTGIGEIYKVKHISGNEFDLTYYSAF